MDTLHIENTVKDYDAWKQAFDAYAPTRDRMGVRAHRITRHLDAPDRIDVDLDFDTREEAAAFATFLETKVWPTPRSRSLVVDHSTPRIVNLVESSPT